MDAGDVIDVAKTPIGENETAGELLDDLAVLGADLLSKTLTRFTQGKVEGTPQDESKVSYAPMLDKTMSPIDWNQSAQQIHNHVRGLHPWGTPQDESKVSYAPMLDKTMSPIDWNQSAQQIHNHVRGLHPWPVATTEIDGTMFKIHQTVLVDETTDKPAGTPVIDGTMFKIHQTVLVDETTDKPAGTPVALTKTGLKMACGDARVIEIRQIQAQGGKRMAAPDYFRGHPLVI